MTETKSAPPRASLSDRKRQAIVSAAIEAFQAHGYQATSMDRIAALAQVSKRTVYNHFDSKEALFEHINDCLLAELLSAGDVGYQADTPLEVQLMDLANREVHAMTSERFLTFARCALSAYFHAPDMAARAWQRVQAPERGLERWLRAAEADGRLKVRAPKETARRFSAMLKEFLLWPQLLFGAPHADQALRDRAITEAVRTLLAACQPG
jgi:TetR/AcrR family transcriptional regulator of autoinduction and epiphytic fitness